MVKEKKVLNKEQLRAIKFGPGPLLIIAGAGTGKTTVITERIKYLISSCLVKPAEILALTFTEKAALEMEERVDQIMPYGFTQMWISTFHSFGDRVLRDDALSIGLDSHYVLMTEAEAILFLRQNIYKFSLNYFRPAGNPTKFLNGLLSHFSRLKDEDILPSEYLRWVQVKSSKCKVQSDNAKLIIDQNERRKNLELARAYQKYEELKIKNGLLDFSDLISKTLQLFRTRKNILARYQKKFKYVLVDEFQDTNIAQYELIKLLGFPRKKPNLTVVGDDSQSIYKFRGAAVSNMLNFMKDYPRAKMITLIKNYRSTQKILDHAYKLIKHNDPDTLENRLGINKNLICAKKIKAQEIKLFFANRVEDEADLVAKEIKKLTTKPSNHLTIKPYNYSDFAILVRANNHADPFVRSFLRFGIPFQFLGPGKLLRQEEVKDLTAYLRILYNFEDNIAFFRVISLPVFNISARDIAAIRNWAKKYHLSLFEAAEQADKLLISNQSKTKINSFIKMIHQHLKLIPRQTAGQILYYFLQDSGLLKKLVDYQTTEAEQKAQNIAKFFDKLKSFEADHEDAGLEAVVDWLNLKMEMGESPLATDLDWTQENKVNLLTIHSAKGLEFPVVFLVNLVNDRFPTRHRREQIPIPDELVKEVLPVGDSHEQEERRLFYVGMTRAKKRLYFTAAKFYGEAKRIKKISPFVFEALGKQFNNLTIKQSPQQSSLLSFQPPSPTSHLPPSPHPVTYLSYSQIQTYERCPLQYKYSYVLRLPVPPSAPASFGISLHLALKNFYELVQKNTPPQKKDLPEILEANWQRLGYTSKEHEQKMYKRAQKMLTGFWQKGFSKSQKPLALEQTFTIKITRDLRIGGRIDRVDQLPGEMIEIIDYKTGKVMTQKEIDKDQQMTFYCLAACNPGIYNQDPQDVVLSFYYLETQEKISTRRTLHDLNKTSKDLVNQAQEINQSDFSPRPGPYCDFCPFKLLCPAWQ